MAIEWSELIMYAGGTFVATFIALLGLLEVYDKGFGINKNSTPRSINPQADSESLKGNVETSTDESGLFVTPDKLQNMIEERDQAAPVDIVASEDAMHINVNFNYNRRPAPDDKIIINRHGNIGDLKKCLRRTYFYDMPRVELLWMDGESDFSEEEEEDVSGARVIHRIKCRLVRPTVEGSLDLGIDMDDRTFDSLQINENTHLILFAFDNIGRH